MLSKDNIFLSTIETKQIHISIPGTELMYKITFIPLDDWYINLLI